MNANIILFLVAAIGAGRTLADCRVGWSEWINDDNPSTGLGEQEGWTKAQQKEFCPDGDITAFECQTTAGMAYHSTGDILQCFLEAGLKCLNDQNVPNKCKDYQVRYQCDCLAPTTTEVITTTTSGAHFNHHLGITVLLVLGLCFAAVYV